MTSSIEPIWCIAGPTAAGKSALCTAIATALPVEFINVDSATIYRGMDIGTAKPDLQERQALHHHLLDILDPTQTYSVAQFYDDACKLITQIQARERIPILVGGTMMYFHALRQGLTELPSAHPEIRQHIEQDAAKAGWQAMHARLQAVDPETAARLPAGDRQRIGRALEVYEASGRPLSDWLKAPASTRPPINLRMISLEPSERHKLHTRIEQRFDAMLAQGFLQEVRTLYDRADLSPELPSMRCVGYRQLWDVVAGDVPLEDARQKALTATRHLAKRQLTWLRAMPERLVFDCLDSNLAPQVLRQIEQDSGSYATTT